MHQDVERLFAIAKENGSITEKQRDIIISKAEQLGEDMTDVYFILENLPVKKSISEYGSNQTIEVRQDKPHSEKLGSIKKCPMCGAIVHSYNAFCPDCHYEFENVSTNSSMERLLSFLQDVDNSSDNGLLDKDSIRKKKSIIQHFPIPNSKSDIFEFIVALQPKALNTDDKLAYSYFIKYQECINKAKTLFPNDAFFNKILSDYNEVKKEISKYKRKKSRIIIWLIILVIAILLLLFLPSFLDEILWILEDQEDSYYLLEDYEDSILVLNIE